MNAYVLDTSVAAAWYLPESFSQRAREWRGRLLAGDVRLIVPGLHYQEFANILRKYVKRGELTRDLASEIFDTHLMAPLAVCEPARPALLATALEYDATAYDAVYISLALEQQTPMLTAERSTSPWVVKLGDLARPIG